jgi:hypothetical protein
MLGLRLTLLGSLLLLLTACNLLNPSEKDMQAAVGAYIIDKEEYPKSFVIIENFVFTNLQKIPDSQPTQFRVTAEFDITYNADGDLIVAELDKKHKQSRQKEKRLTNNPFDEIKGAITGAFDNFRYENRFKNVRKGDQDHYAGDFIFMRNADSSWRVEKASYE